MTKLVTVLAIASTLVLPAGANARTYHAAAAQVTAHAYASEGYLESHYGGGARGDPGLPLGHGTANSPGGVVGGEW